MNKRNLILKTAIAAALGLAAASANAGTVAFLTMADYAVEGVPASGAVTIPAGITYTTTGTAAESGLLTITLPAGVTFVSTPAIAIDGAIVTAATVGGGGAGSNSMVINYTKTAVVGGTIKLGAFQVTGATALSSVTAAGAFQVSAQSSGFPTASNNDVAPVRTDLATSSRQLIVTPAPAALTINVPAPSNATRWLVIGNSIATAGSVGTLIVNTGTARNAANTAAFAFTSATASATITGNFSGVSSAYLAPATGVCAATAPAGSTTGTVTPTAITFAGITPAAGAREVCLGATGTAILQQTPSGVNVSATQDTFTTTPAGTLGTIKYNGGVFPLNYVVGSAAGGYTNYIRVVNRDSAASDVRAVVQNDNGTVSTGLLGSVPANQSTLYTVGQINAATGSTLSSATDRGAITILTNSSNTTASNLMFNPNGTVVQMP